MRIGTNVLGLLAFAAALWIGGAAGAATNYSFGTFVGTSFDFVDANETVQTPDDEASAQFEAPAVIGNQLVFSPSSFEADSFNGAGFSDFDTTHSTFNTTIMSTAPGATIDIIDITEGGDIILSAFPPGSGTAATGVIATLSGTIQILDALDISYIGQFINFGGALDPFPTTFTPGPIDGQLFVGLQPAGTFGWTGSVSIDIASYFPGIGATKVELQLNNILQANSEAGTSAIIQKKAVNGPVITVIPEPGTAALLLGGLAALVVRARTRRS